MYIIDTKEIDFEIVEKPVFNQRKDWDQLLENQILKSRSKNPNVLDLK